VDWVAVGDVKYKKVILFVVHLSLIIGLLVLGWSCSR
jgi:hypothetical protein